ncbi:MAG: hypothetical protein K1X64_10320 [Myxococcaceae bacterium]|nr:hypothetical protein [Myxococcaceae bacterium]
MIRRAISLSTAVLAFTYPLWVWLLSGHVAAVWLGAGLVTLGLARAGLARGPQAVAQLAVGLAMVLLGAAVMLKGDAQWVRWYPVLVNATLLAIFGASLAKPPSVVERLARLTRPRLSPSAIRYTRNVTAVWCAFFVVNGTLALITAACASFDVWSLYNGVLAYLGMGLIFAVELMVRQRHLRKEAAT